MKRSSKARQNRREVILAGGGVLWNRSSRDPLVALVRRIKYGDWALPKGKLKRGETFEDAAIREVREETGCIPKLGDFVGMVYYAVGKDPKVVLYWNMDCARRPTYRSNSEIASVDWLTPQKALRRMSYAGERKILRASLKLQR